LQCKPNQPCVTFGSLKQEKVFDGDAQTARFGAFKEEEKRSREKLMALGLTPLITKARDLGYSVEDRAACMESGDVATIKEALVELISKKQAAIRRKDCFR
jgi:hypothetical protein